MANFTLTTGDDAFAGGDDDDQFSGPPGGTDTLSGGGGADSFNYSASGDPQSGPPGQQGLGTLSQGSLEMSNVKVVEEMINLISSQRAYDINSKVIQAGDEMLQTTANTV